MQVVYKNKDEGDNNGRADTVDFIIYIGEISRHIEEKCAGRLRRRTTEI